MLGEPILYTRARLDGLLVAIVAELKLELDPPMMVSMVRDEGTNQTYD